jgi:hypothetical protein
MAPANKLSAKRLKNARAVSAGKLESVGAWTDRHSGERFSLDDRGGVIVCFKQLAAGCAEASILD